MKILILEASPS